MRTEPPIVAAAKEHGIDSFRELIDEGLYTVNALPKQSVNEIRKMLEESDKLKAHERQNI